MNAKKIMGAVLVALLAAALFVGAGSAVGDVDGDTVFFYQQLSGDYAGTWNNGVNSFTIDANGGFVSNTALPEGKYSYNDSVAIYLKKPTATISGTATVDNAQYIAVNGGNIYEGSALTLNGVSPVTGTVIDSYLVTGPDGIPTKVSSLPSTANKLGEYKIQAVFANTNFATGVPDDALVSDVIFTYKVVKATAVEVTGDAETIIKEEAVAITITGKPGLTFTITGDFTVASAGTVVVTDDVPVAGTTDKYDVYTMPNTGKAVLYLKADKDSGSGKITVTPVKSTTDATAAGDAKSITITIKKGTITAQTDKEFYYIGNDVKLSGTTTAGNLLYLYIAGTNKDFTELTNVQIDVDAGAWECKIEGSYFKNFDAGTYTAYIATNTGAVEVSKLETYTTVSLVLKQPFISITDAPAVAVQGTDYKVTGTAEATDGIKYYVFGTNYFGQDNAAVEKGVFEIEFKIQNMDAGQYFMVVQHPMYDKVYNIQIVNDSVVTNQPAKWPVYLYDSNGQQIGAPLFNVTDRQKTNAAQALVDELAGQNIDDMYVKLSFVVAAPSSVINPIPSEITKGSKLTISGSTNVGEGELVTVEMISTAFAAQPKETVGSASFIALTTKTDENGNWEITFDTTGLNVDEYTVTAAVANLNTATAKVNVIEGAPTEQPTTTPTTTPTQEQPTETPVQTPGFGALAALAGLGAVAVLLLRRE